MSTRITTPPNPNPLRINLLPRRRIRDGITIITTLQRRDDLLSRLPRRSITRAKPAIVIHETVQRESGSELLRELIECHFFQRREAVCHYEAGEFCAMGPAAGGDGGGVEPPAEGDTVGGAEFDVFARHGGLDCGLQMCFVDEESFALSESLVCWRCGGYGLRCLGLLE
jgi:hypothetical protein